MNIASKACMLFLTVAMASTAVIPRQAYAATHSSYAEYFFDTNGNIVGGKGLGCNNFSSQGGITTEYAVYEDATCSSTGFPEGPYTVEAILPPNITQAQACATIAEAGESACGTIPGFHWPLH
jgi:hypothetical protein